MPDSGSYIDLDAEAALLAEPSLYDALKLIEADRSLAPNTRTQWCCSLRRIPHFLGRDPRHLPARMSALRHALGELHHANLGIGRKSLANHRSNLRAALLHARGVQARKRSLAPAWAELVAALGDKPARRGLSRFVRFCSDKDVAPEAVTAETVEACVRHAIETSFLKRPNGLRKQIPRAWSRARTVVPNWPPFNLPVPDFRRPHRKPLADFPQGFVADVESYLAWLAGDVVLDKPERLMACKPSTVQTRRRELVGAANAALESGTDMAALESLADLTAPETVRGILEVYLARKGGEAEIFVIELAGKLSGIARDWVGRSGQELEVLEGYARRLARKRKSGLTDKNLALIRQIKQPQVWQRLCAAPQRMMAEAERETTALHKAAVTAQIAVAIQILIVAPMRISNLARLHLETNLMRPADPEGPIHLVIPDHDVKNGVSLEYPLPLGVSRLLDRYLSQFRHRVKGANGPWLFPGEHGSHKTQRTLSKQISERLWQEAGIRMTPHQFRHAAAAVVLEAQPGNYELVRRVLGHRNIQTTSNFYVGLESLDAARAFGELALERGEARV